VTFAKSYCYNMYHMKKTIVMTGTSRGIGLAIAKKLLVEGHEIIGLARTHTLNHENYIPKRVDLADLKFLPDHLQAVQREFSEVDALICNAGVWHWGNFEELSFDEMRHILNVNFLSQIFLVKTFLPQMKAQKSGDILFIGSESAQKGPAKQGVYAASKSALATFAKSLRSECATKNIRVTTIYPGSVKTDMFDAAPFSLGEDAMHAILPEDIASLISFLLQGRCGTVFDEIHLSPQKHHLEKKYANHLPGDARGN
jgi:NADP-dependent 3-hydroxy acid dehydrogenase YdfG